MKTVNRLLILLSVISIVLTGCSGHEDSVTIRIVETSDVHGHIFDMDCMTGQERTGSFAKFSTFLNRVRKENRNVIYVADLQQNGNTR